MKKIGVSLTIAVLAFSFTFGQKRPPVKQVTITASQIASQPAGVPKVIDLTRSGTIYRFQPDIDPTRVQLHTTAGDVALSDVCRKAGAQIHDFYYGGLKSDLRKIKLTPHRSGPTNYTCMGGFCVCYGDADCNDLFTTDACGPGAVCFPGNGVCICKTAN